jgi:hypothetical protein
MSEFHPGGLVAGSVRARIAVDECVLIRPAGADGAWVCGRRDQQHVDVCDHDPVAFTDAMDIDGSLERLRAAARER